jgi:predicted RNA-binding protein with PUA-like domain
MRYWLMKSEPDAYAWSQLVADGIGHWDGVRNHQAAANLRAMQVGDRAFFYHSNIGKEIVGVMAIVRVWHPDPGDATGKWGIVDVKPLQAAKTAVTLARIKADDALGGMALLRQSRLSVSPVTAAEWKRICKLAGMPA